MSTGSPTAYLLWAILSSIFLVFLIVHLWLYDRFNCVKWDSGRQPGAFKRVMTYSYLGTVPLLVIFSVAMTTIKFQEGYFVTSTQIIPRPLQFWSDEHRRWLFPLNVIFSIAWALELVTHLEELAFWLFLLHQGPEKRNWFDSWEYKTWSLGSMLAVIGMPLTAVVSRGEVERTQAWILFVGSIASTSTTISFLYVLFRFPIFIKHVKQGGAEPDVVVRLATFFNLNRIRVVFRFFFTIPLLTIGVDALCPPYYVILNPFALDFLLMMGGIGSFVSSAITLFIFFPRSMTREAGYTTKASSPQQSDKAPISTLPEYYHEHSHHAYPLNHLSQQGDLYNYDPSTPKVYEHLPPVGLNGSHGIMHAMGDGMQPHLLTFVHSPHERHGGHIPRRSEEFSIGEGEETESSPEYESEVDDISSNEVPSPRSASRNVHREATQLQEGRYGLHNHPDRQDSSNTAVSGETSDDTMWEREQTTTHAPTAAMTPAAALAAATRTVAVGTTGSLLWTADLGIPGTRPLSPRSPISRRHSDTLFVRHKHDTVLSANSGSFPISEDGHMQGGLHERRLNLCREVDRRKPRESSTSVALHPYLMNWTSPLDLLDTFPSSHPQSSYIV